MAGGRAMGRPTKLTVETRDRLFDGISMGMSYRAACAHAGIDYSTFCRWRERGAAQQRGEFREFCDLLTDAKAIGEARLVVRIDEASKREVPGDWRAALAILERRHPEEWGKKDKLDADLHHDGGVTVVFRHIPARDC